jgi:nucleotide-binding universal stress UspA family protein
VPRGHGSVADALIGAAESWAPAYVVMGAYGHSRVREFLLGGVTRDMLMRSPVPLLMAH